VQGVVTTQQIEQLPISRNFLDLAQLEPGVQIQDGQTFDPTKNGFSSISIGGRAGRTARINVGSFGRGVTAGNLGAAISNYNSKYAGTITPAGQALINAGLFTQAELVSAGAVMPTLAAPPSGNIGLGWLKTFDVTYAYPIKIKERIEIIPSVSAFNAFNFANFDGPTNKMSGILSTDGAPGSPNGTPDRSATRIGVGSGIFALGGPRQLEFGLRINF
jgi:hypothetical protein